MLNSIGRDDSEVQTNARQLKHLSYFSVTSKKFDRLRNNYLLFQSLRENNSKMSSEPFADYEAAVERASWVRKGAAKVLLGRSGVGKGALGWESCTVELEQTGTNQNEVDFGTLSIFGTQKKHLKVLFLCGYLSFKTALTNRYTLLRVNPGLFGCCLFSLFNAVP